MKTSTYTLTLTMRAPIHIPRDIVENVLDYSTALEALEEGIWNWIPLEERDVMESNGESLFDLSLEVGKGRFDEDDEGRCEHGKFRSGAGACPMCAA